MTDAFDRWIEWANRPSGRRAGFASEIYATVMSLPQEDHADQQKVNPAVEHQAELSRTGRTAWIYLNDHNNGTQSSPGVLDE
ncbi:hypothetical protein [Bradyrhizobium sp. Gha]|uniref:hypothetical protein n=1 Tax=Bradyrhizobium sp. Gha TaxID=1855318 RepID=UPI0008EBB9AD|nr:hypothetical protein [Bradyrhizobium sp. Gha]SFJ60388.1 hypothetical protein SAMN05216525_12974 [Bradyrhizobium sp. Gha]